MRKVNEITHDLVSEHIHDLMSRLMGRMTEANPEIETALNKLQDLHDKRAQRIYQ